MDGLDFQLEIEQSLRGGEALTTLEKTEQAFTDAKQTADLYSREIAKLDAALTKNTERLGETREALLRAITDGDTKQIQKLTAKYQDLEREEARIKAKADAARTALEKQNATLQSAASKFGKMASAEKQAATADEEAEKRTKALHKEIVGLTGGAGRFVERVEKLGQELGPTNALMILGAGAAIALTAAVIAMAAAFTAAYVAVGKYALEQANAKRNQEQTLRALTQSNEKATQLNDAFTNIAKGTGISEDRLVDMTRGLTTAREQMGLARLSGAQLEKALYSLSVQEQALGDSSGTQNFIDQLNAGALTVEQLGDRIDKKYSNVVEQKMLGLDQQLATFKANVTGLFAHINIEPFLRGLSRMVALFDSSTASGRAIQSLFETLFGPTANNADAFFIKVERAILKTELQLLLFSIRAKAAWKKFNDAIDSVNLGPLGSLRDMINKVSSAMGDALENYLPKYIASISTILSALGDAQSFGGKIGKGFKDAWSDAKDWVEKIVNLGKSIIDGITEKITGGAERVASAIRKLMKGAVDAAKDAIDAHSPSRLYMRAVGEPIPQGIAAGIVKEGDAVAEAVDAVVQPATGGASSGSTSLAVTGNHYHFHGVKDAEDAKDSFFDSIGEYLDRLADQSGAIAPAGG